MDIVPLPANPEVMPGGLPAADTGSLSSCTIIPEGGPGLTIWSTPGVRCAAKSDCEIRLQLSPDAPVIVGRQDGGEIEYLDPRYAPSPIMPGSRRTILRQGGQQQDMYVSRGHFMLRGRGAGVLFTNGVPRRGGGIRPPRNGTQLLAPQTRSLLCAEEIVILHGEEVTISLPNGTRLRIQAG